MQSIIALTLCSSGAFGQYNVDYNMGPYTDTPVLKSVVEIGDNQLISVGTISSFDFGVIHNDIALTKTDASGNVIWDYRYGQFDQNETGNGIALSWDANHVIIVGTVAQTEAPGTATDIIPLTDAITMKIRISDGALIWTTTHGEFSNSEQGLLIERVQEGGLSDDGTRIDRSYVVVGTASGDASQSFRRMYAFKLTESGGEVWSKRYLLSQNFPISSINPMSMVKNGPGKLMIAGTQTEINRPTDIFTTGISTLNGSIQDVFVEYTVSNVNHIKECAIAKDPDGSGYALAFTTDGYHGNCFTVADDLVSSSVDRIGVMRLFNDRRVRWTNVYWKPSTDDQKAVAIDIKGGVYNIATSYNMDDGFINRPGFLSINKVNSLVINSYMYYSSTLNPYGAAIDCMIPAKSGGYVLKNFINNNGFTLIRTNDYGISECMEDIRIIKCTATTTPKAKKSSPTNYGSVALNFSPRHVIDYFSINCSTPIKTNRQHGELDDPDHIDRSVKTDESSENKMTIYPSPVGKNQDVVSVRFNAEAAYVSVTINVYNATGKIVSSSIHGLSQGKNIIPLNVQELSSGMFTVVMTSDKGIMNRAKFVKQ